MLTRRESIALAGCASAWFGDSLAPAQSPGNRTAELTPSQMVPFRWNPGWTDPTLIALFEGGPVNRLVVEGSLAPPVVEAARKAGLAVLEWSALAPTPLAQANWTSFDKSRVCAGDDAAASLPQAEGLIHATPTGMLGHPGLPLPAELIRCELWVAEVVYFPLETELLRAAGRLGCHTLNGGGMAVRQAVEAFRLFTGIEADPDRMRRRSNSMVQAA
jgi:shikimate dehydrogenase